MHGQQNVKILCPAYKITKLDPSLIQVYPPHLLHPVCLQSRGKIIRVISYTWLLGAVNSKWRDTNALGAAGLLVLGHILVFRILFLRKCKKFRKPGLMQRDRPETWDWFDVLRVGT